MLKRKKLLTLILTAVMLCSMAVPGAYAADGYAVADYDRYVRPDGDFAWAVNELTLAVASELFGGYPPEGDKDGIYYWRGLGITKVKFIGKLHPDRNITRGEFATITVKALDMEAAPYAESPFEDVKESAWYGKNVLRLVKAGIIKQEDYGPRLYPDKPINRLEIAVWMARAAKLAGAAKPEPVQVNFKDFNPASKYAGEVAEAVSLGILRGYPDGTFRPTANARRAEAAVMLVKMLKHVPIYGGIDKDTAGKMIKQYFDIETKMQKAWYPDYQAKMVYNEDFEAAFKEWQAETNGLLTDYNREIRMHPEGLYSLRWAVENDNRLTYPCSVGISPERNPGYGIAGILPLKVAQDQGYGQDFWYVTIPKVEVVNLIGHGPIVEVNFRTAAYNTYVDGNTIGDDIVQTVPNSPAEFSGGHVLFVKQGGRWKIAAIWGDDRSPWLNIIKFTDGPAYDVIRLDKDPWLQVVPYDPNRKK